VTDIQENTFPINALVSRRCNELGLSPAQLIRRCGYGNVSKGLRRLDQLRTGDFKHSAGLIEKLPAALGVSPDAVQSAVNATQQLIHDAEEAAWRAAFKPHAVLLTERERPSPLFIAAIIGIDELLRVDFDLTQNPDSFRDQAIDGLRQKLKRWHGNLPAFGRPTGFIVNYSPDHAVEFDVTGNPVRIVDQAHRPGQVQYFIGGREVSKSLQQIVLSHGKITVLDVAKGRG
jgi:hypothetical protein